MGLNLQAHPIKYEWKKGTFLSTPPALATRQGIFIVSTWLGHFQVPSYFVTDTNFSEVLGELFEIVSSVDLFCDYFL